MLMRLNSMNPFKRPELTSFSSTWLHGREVRWVTPADQINQFESIKGKRSNEVSPSIGSVRMTVVSQQLSITSSIRPIGQLVCVDRIEELPLLDSVGRINRLWASVHPVSQRFGSFPSVGTPVVGRSPEIGRVDERLGSD